MDKKRGLRLRELETQEATTFPASPFALKAQLNDEILLGGFSPSKFTEQDFQPVLKTGQGAFIRSCKQEAIAERA